MKYYNPNYLMILEKAIMTYFLENKMTNETPQTENNNFYELIESLTAQLNYLKKYMNKMSQYSSYEELIDNLDTGLNLIDGISDANTNILSFKPTQILTTKNSSAFINNENFNYKLQELTNKNQDLTNFISLIQINMKKIEKERNEFKIKCENYIQLNQQLNDIIENNKSNKNPHQNRNSLLIQNARNEKKQSRRHDHDKHRLMIFENEENHKEKHLISELNKYRLHIIDLENKLNQSGNTENIKNENTILINKNKILSKQNQLIFSTINSIDADKNRIRLSNDFTLTNRTYDKIENQINTIKDKNEIIPLIMNILNNILLPYINLKTNLTQEIIYKRVAIMFGLMIYDYTDVSLKRFIENESNQLHQIPQITQINLTRLSNELHLMSSIYKPKLQSSILVKNNIHNMRSIYPRCLINGSTNWNEVRKSSILVYNDKTLENINEILNL